MLIFVPVEEYTPLFVSGRDCLGVLKLFMRNILDIMFVLKISLQKVVFIEERSKKCLYLHILYLFIYYSVAYLSLYLKLEKFHYSEHATY